MTVTENPAAHIPAALCKKDDITYSSEFRTYIYSKIGSIITECSFLLCYFSNLITSTV